MAARLRELNDGARRELARIPFVKLRTPRDPALSAGITAFEIDGLSPDEVVKRLREKRIIATTSPYKVTYPRISFGLANSEADVEKVVFDNPVAFFAQSGKPERGDFEARRIDQSELFEGNSVLRGQSPVKT